MSFRRTRGIVTDSDFSDPRNEADVIMTAAALGFAASYVVKGTPLRFDIDPRARAKDAAGKEPDARMRNVTHATNLADQITGEMSATDEMVFNGDPGPADIAAYTHGMIQAIYKGYALGPNCTPYEIAVGAVTTKMATCLPCTLFMVAQGYPPTSIHLGRGESWAPLYQPYNPGGEAESNELAVIRDLNNSWRTKCAEWLTLGVQILDDAHIADDHKTARDALRSYLSSNGSDKTVATTLVLDAVTVHESESVRIGRTLN